MPIVQTRKITTSKKNTGYEQYILTIPKNYGDSLVALGIDELLVVLNSFGGVLVPVKNKENAKILKKRVLLALPKIADLISARKEGAKR